MSDVEDANDEGGDPQVDIEKQNKGKTATGHPDDANHSDHKTQDAVKAGRPDMDFNAAEE